MSDDPQDGDKVGYRNPPKGHRFKKGQPSPNPKGRPKKEASIFSAIKVCLGEDLVVTAKDGTKSTMLAAEVIGKKVVGQAASGDISSQRLLLALEKTDAARQPREPEQAAPDPEAVARSQRLTCHLSRILRVTASCGMFVVDEEYGLAPSDIGAPLIGLHSGLLGSQIRTAEQYKEARRNALAQTKEAFDAYAVEQLRPWKKNIQKSDLE
jgi:hypothetical protein